jgi:hypothetical protein
MMRVDSTNIHLPRRRRLVLLGEASAEFWASQL